MSTYTVQPGDTPMRIAHKLVGSSARANELVRMNPHKPLVRVGKMTTFRDLAVGERLAVPPRWSGTSGLGQPSTRPHSSPSRRKHPKSRKGVSGQAYPQPAPHFAVRPRAGGDGGGDDSGHGVEPILTITGVGKGCCASCAQGGPCEMTCESGCPSPVQMPPCSAPQAPPSIPGSTSFPVGFGQTDDSSSTTSSASSTLSTAGAALSGWGVPLTVGAISIAAGFGLAYVITHK